MQREKVRSEMLSRPSCCRPIRNSFASLVGGERQAQALLTQPRRELSRRQRLKLRFLLRAHKDSYRSDSKIKSNVFSADILAQLSRNEK